jgi:type I restriction enzyme S subunit
MQTVITYYKDLSRWDIKSYLWRLKSPFPVESLGKYIYEHSEKVNIFKENEKEFPILGVTNKEGVYLNAYVKGKNINQPYKKVKGGELTYNPYRVNVGSIGIVQNEYDGFYISPAYVVFGTKEGLLNEYLYFVLSSEWFNPYLRAATSGSVRQNLTYDLLYDLQVPIPPLEVQERIIDKWHEAQDRLNKVKSERLKKETSIDLYVSKELGISTKAVDKRKGPFIVNFANFKRWDVPYNSKEHLPSKKAKYEWKKLREFCISTQYGYTGTAVELDTGVRFLRITDLDYFGQYKEDLLPFVKISESEKRKYLLQEGDFLIARTGATAGKCGLINKTKQDVIFASYLIRFHFTNEIFLPFLEQYLNQGPGKRIVADIVYSSNQPNINANEIQEISIPLSPKIIQKDIFKKVNKIRKSIFEDHKKMNKYLFEVKREVEKILKK